jgi:hypothetical protein
MMDIETLISCKLSGVRRPDRRFVECLTNLTSAEQDVYRVLRDNRLGDNVRLEKEHVPVSLLEVGLAQGVNRTSGTA